MIGRVELGVAHAGGEAPQQVVVQGDPGLQFGHRIANPSSRSRILSIPSDLAPSSYAGDPRSAWDRPMRGRRCAIRARFAIRDQRLGIRPASSARAAARTPRLPFLDAASSASTAGGLPIRRRAAAAAARWRRVRSGALQSPWCSASFSASTASGPPKDAERRRWRRGRRCWNALAIDVPHEVAEQRRGALVADRRRARSTSVSRERPERWRARAAGSATPRRCR